MRQVFSPRHGFVVPEDVTLAGFTQKVLDCHKRVSDLYEKLEKDLGAVASYVVLHGHRVRWIMGMNDRAAMHMLELRTVKQGHPQYRKLAQQMHDAIAAVDPWRAEIMSFVDHNDYTSARGESEARQRVKENGMDKKFGINY
jgi:thymidylate synthase ThyX